MARLLALLALLLTIPTIYPMHGGPNLRQEINLVQDPVAADPVANPAPAVNAAQPPVFYGPQLYDPQTDKDFMAHHSQNTDRILDVMKAQHRLHCHDAKLMRYNPDADFNVVERYKDSEDEEKLSKALAAIFRLRAHEPVDAPNPLLRKLHKEIVDRIPYAQETSILITLPLYFVPFFGWWKLYSIVSAHNAFLNSLNALRIAESGDKSFSTFAGHFYKILDQCKKQEGSILEKMRSLEKAGNQGQPEYQYLKEQQLSIKEVWDLLFMMYQKKAIDVLENIQSLDNRTCQLYKKTLKLLIEINQNLKTPTIAQKIAKFEEKGKEFIEAYEDHGNLRNDLHLALKIRLDDWVAYRAFGTQDPTITKNHRKLLKFKVYVGLLIQCKQYDNMDTRLLNSLKGRI